jgi:DNA polymerase (family 10)
MEPELSNKEVGNLLKTLAALMELHGENEFKIKTYSNASFQIGRVPEPVMMMDQATMEATKGIGKSVAARLLELRSTGTIAALEQLYAITPPGIVDMLRIKGLGAKKVSVIWKELGVESPGELLYACYENRLAKLKGFGEKTQQSVIESIEYYQSNMGKFHFAVVLSEALLLESIWPDNGNWERSGPFRREDNIIEVLEWITTLPADQLPVPGGWQTNGNTHTAMSANGIPLRLTTVQPVDFARTLFQQTGCPLHVERVLAKVDVSLSFSHETEIYAAAGLPFIPPFLRENLAEWSFKKSEQLSEIIQAADIKGVVHNHSTWSDGRHTIREMAEACIAMGYEYLVMSDHSRTAVYAGGLEIERVLQQHQEIDALNIELAPFRIFKSIESDILNDGSLDYPDDILHRFDLVIASVHQNLRMDIDKATNRLLRAIQHPYTTILGHMTGRLLLSRLGYPLDFEKIIDACAEYGVAIEVNANPYRLDMDYTWIPYAQEKGVLIPINPDAHSTQGIRDIFFGVTAARKGGLKKQHTLNARSLPEFEKWLQERKEAKGIA